MSSRADVRTAPQLARPRYRWNGCGAVGPELGCHVRGSVSRPVGRPKHRFHEREQFRRCRRHCFGAAKQHAGVNPPHGLRDIPHDDLSAVRDSAVRHERNDGDPQSGFDHAHDGLDARRAAFEGDVKHLRALAEIVREKTWRVERFLRVACPARGLGATRLDTFLSILMNLAGGGTQGSRVLSQLTLTAVKHRLTFEDLPGLEAMRATSPLVALINSPRCFSDADLNVVAGNVSETTQGRWFTALFSDSFFSDAGDLVVPSKSTLGGWKRQGPVTQWEEGRTSTHYRYFDDDAVCRKVVAWLTSTVPSRGRTTAR